MCATSINTFARAFNSPNNLGIAKEAGNYTNKALAKNTKIFLGVISLGILYGLAELFEHVANVRPKIREFAKLNCNLYNAIVNRGQNENSVTIQIGQGKKFEFSLKGGTIYVFEEGNLEGKDMGVSSFEELSEKIHQDSLASPELYADLHFTPTIGASIDLSKAEDSLPEYIDVVKKIKSALDSVARPDNGLDYRRTLKAAFDSIADNQTVEKGTNFKSDAEIVEFSNPDIDDFIEAMAAKVYIINKEG